MIGRYLDSTGVLGWFLIRNPEMIYECHFFNVNTISNYAARACGRTLDCQAKSTKSSKPDWPKMKEFSGACHKPFNIFSGRSFY